MNITFDYMVLWMRHDINPAFRFGVASLVVITFFIIKEVIDFAFVGKEFYTN